MARPEPMLRMRVQRSGARAVLHLAGEADVTVEGRLRMRLRDLIDPRRAHPVTELTVDVAQLEFVDLAAHDVLVAAADELGSRGGRLVLRAPGRRVRRLLALVRSPLAVQD